MGLVASYFMSFNIRNTLKTLNLHELLNTQIKQFFIYFRTHELGGLTPGQNVDVVRVVTIVLSSHPVSSHDKKCMRGVG